MIHLLVEGSSELALFVPWAERLLGAGKVRVHRHEGKGELPRDIDARPDPRQRQLLAQLPAKLRGYANSAAAANDRVIVLVDADDDDPDVLAQRIREVATQIAPELDFAVQVAVEQ